MTESTAENSQPKTRAFPTVWQAIVLLALLVILQLGATVVVAAYQAIQSIPNQELTTLLTIVSVSTFGATAIVAVAWSRIPAGKSFTCGVFRPFCCCRCL